MEVVTQVRKVKQGSLMRQVKVSTPTPHPLKTNGYPLVVVPLLLYCDDTSGNESKK